MFSPHKFVVRFFIGFILGVVTVHAAQVAFADDWDDWDYQCIVCFEEKTDEFYNPPPSLYEKHFPDIDVNDGYNWDTGEYHDIDVIQEVGNEVEIYNWDTGEYEWVIK